MPWSSQLECALQAAALAGEILRRRYSRRRSVQRKGWRDIVTDADLAAQRAAAEFLHAATPDYAILAEEGLHADLAGPAPLWVMDPLDGTQNYAHHIPLFCVSLALVRGGQSEVGVVYDPLRGETFFAERGGGAFLQVGRARPRPIRVSKVSELSEAMVGLGWPREPELRQRVNAATARVGAICQTLRAMGSAALNFAYVAAGRMDGLYHLAVQPWDTAAGSLLVTEAGGCLSAMDGGEWQLGQSQVVVSNSYIHTALIRALNWQGD
ncbi:MAG: inositol monophosphatase family protein [Anaerolineales bacterium]|nr:inositol monophosphatase family protein [Anaerolineales bacterium]